jgi:aspartate aminotransferase-like enzyme
MMNPKKQQLIFWVLYSFYTSGVKRLREKHRIAIDGGYGKLKGKTFRLSNMGDETKETITELLAALDDTLG